MRKSQSLPWNLTPEYYWRLYPLLGSSTKKLPGQYLEWYPHQKKWKWIKFYKDGDKVEIKRIPSKISGDILEKRAWTIIKAYQASWQVYHDKLHELVLRLRERIEE